ADIAGGDRRLFHGGGGVALRRGGASATGKYKRQQECAMRAKPRDAPTSTRQILTLTRRGVHSALLRGVAGIGGVVVGGGQLAPAIGGAAHGAGDQLAQAAFLEGRDRGMGGAPGRSDPAAKLGGRFARLGQHARRAQNGLQHQRAGGVGGQALGDGGV